MFWIRNWAYLVHHILKRNGAVNSKADKEEIRFWVRERSKSVILFLACCIPESQLHRFARRPMNSLCNIVLKNSGNVFLVLVSLRNVQDLVACGWTYLREIPLRVADQEACLAAAPVPYHHEFLRISWRQGDVCRLRHLSSRHTRVGAHCTSIARIADSHTLASGARSTWWHRWSGSWIAIDWMAPCREILIPIPHGHHDISFFGSGNSSGPKSF